MITTETTYKTKCDFAGCKNMAKVSFCSEFDSKRKMNFCSECIKEMYDTYAKQITPKGVEAPFKKQKKLR